MPTALVTDADRLSSLAVVRSLGRQGWTLIATSADEAAITFRSRFTSGWAMQRADPRNGEAYVEHIAALAAGHGVDLVVPVTDEALLRLLPHRDRLPSGCRLASPELSTVEAAMDKVGVVRLA